jgi:CheY-like chemotaxis protein
MDLVARLLAYARNQPLAPQPVDCNTLLEEVYEMARLTFAQDIEVVVSPAPGALRCLADPAQLATALLNLCFNARDAMPDGGRLTVRAARAASEPGVPNGGDDGSVVFTVEDTGQGMSDKTREQAAEPFFTTKGAGEGSGLGLSMVYGFVHQSGGRLQIDSELGAGARISLYLPETDREVAVREPAAGSPAPPVKAHVLLVEDDGLVRSQVQRQLLALGHRVTVAADGVQALKIIAEGAIFDLLLTDVVMPNGLNGRELADRARASLPGLRVLLTSGYSAEEIRRGAGGYGGDGFLPKPYRRSELERKIASLLQPSG